MPTFDTLPTEIRLQIYRHLFAGLRLSYVPYVPIRLRRGDEEMELNPSADVSILFVSRKVLAEARPVLLDSAIIDIDALVEYEWRTHPRNTNFKVGSILRHVRLDLDQPIYYFTRKGCRWTVTPKRLSRCLQNLPALSSLSFDLGDFFKSIPVPLGANDGEIGTAIEQQIDGGLGDMILGQHDPRSVTIAALQASHRGKLSFAVKTRSSVLIMCNGEPVLRMVRNPSE